MNQIKSKQIKRINTSINLLIYAIPQFRKIPTPNLLIKHSLVLQVICAWGGLQLVGWPETSQEIGDAAAICVFAGHLIF